MTDSDQGLRTLSNCYNTPIYEKPLWVRLSMTTKFPVGASVLMGDSQWFTIISRIQYHLAPGTSWLFEFAPLAQREMRIVVEYTVPEFPVACPLDYLQSIEVLSYYIFANPFWFTPKEGM